MASFMATLDALRVAFHIDATKSPAAAIAELNALLGLAGTSTHRRRSQISTSPSRR